ncbi:VTT domain-containing protein [Gluconobacter cerinus]|uniref:TVP38/TMEM64 family protein n=2 Tax=Acetobacteraceae TaxID=433 RepID=UPI001B8D24AE|nr:MULTISPECIES: VTT domain-containing protein [Gluconobacter]MBS0993244.1 VTT domain-containing protein [Gluconobacter cerinus]MBS1021471.1 VTT domain-containing protein [Gluconobacter cerinus]
MGSPISSPPDPELRRTFRQLVPWRAALTIGAMLLCVALLQRLPFIHRLLENAPHWHETPYAAVWFLLLAIPYCACGLPRQALCIAAGLAFGVWGGLGLCSLAYTLGAMAAYGWARVLAPVKFRQRLHDRLQRNYAALARILHRKPFRAVLTLRLMPVGSALLVSMAAGLFELPLPAFALATCLGGLPQNLVFVLVGAGTRIGHMIQLGLAGGLFVVSGVLGALLLRQADE